VNINGPRPRLERGVRVVNRILESDGGIGNVSISERLSALLRDALSAYNLVFFVGRLRELDAVRGYEKNDLFCKLRPRIIEELRTDAGRLDRAGSLFSRSYVSFRYF
jgi:hypothetical protein